MPRVRIQDKDIAEELREEFVYDLFFKASHDGSSFCIVYRVPQSIYDRYGDDMSYEELDPLVKDRRFLPRQLDWDTYLYIEDILYNEMIDGPLDELGFISEVGTRRIAKELYYMGDDRLDKLIMMAKLIS